MTGTQDLACERVRRIRYPDIGRKPAPDMVQCEPNSKGRRHDRLPLPDDVGKALVDHLQHSRPKNACREVFLRLIAPVGPLSPERITGVVHDACARAGVQQVGAHRLRHALATRMLGSGASLAEVGQVLRHSLALTTSLYAKVDVGRLAGLVQPWPGVER